MYSAQFAIHRKLARSTVHTGQFGTLIVVLPSKWEGGVVTLRRGPVSRTFECEDSHRCGGQLQFIAFVAGCELSATSVSSGYRSALIYGLSLLSASGALAQFSAPSWPADVSRLQALLRTWHARLIDESDVDTPERLLIMLHSAGSDGDGALSGSDKSLCELFKHALRGCPQLGGYIARLKITERCTAVSLRDETNYDYYHGDDEESEHGVDEYEWDVEQTEWALTDKVDLLSGAKLRALGQETLDIDDDSRPESTAVIPEADFDLLTDEPDSFVLVGDDGYSATASRKFRHVVLVICLRHDPWQELAASIGTEAALGRLLEEMGSAAISSGAAIAAAPEVTSAVVADSHERLLATTDPLPAASVLRGDLLARGPLAIATSLYDFFLSQRRAAPHRPDNVRLPPSLLAVIVTARHHAASKAVSLLSRIFRDFTSDVVAQPQSVVAAVMALIAGEQGPVTALCDGLRSARIALSTPAYSNALRLARDMLESRRVLQLAADTAIAGQKRRRCDSFEADASTAALCVQAPSADPAVAVYVWRRETGRSVLAAIANSFVVPPGPSLYSEVYELMSLLLAHGQAADVESFVRTKLHMIVGHRETLVALFASRDPAIASAVEQGIVQGIPSLGSMPQGYQGYATLLALAWQICRLCPLPSASHSPDIDSLVFDLNSQRRHDRVAEPCALLAHALSAEPREPATLCLSEAPASAHALCLHIVTAPVEVPNELADRLLRRISSAWPRGVPTTHGADGGLAVAGATGALLLLLLSRPACGDAVPAFLAPRLRLVIGSSAGSNALCRALFRVDPSMPLSSAMWDALVQGVPAVLSYEHRHSNPHGEKAHAVRAATNAATFLSLCVSSLGARGRSPHDGISTLRFHISRLARAFIDAWPAAAFSEPATFDMLRALALAGDAAAAVAFLPRVSPKLLLGELLSRPGIATDGTPRRCLLASLVQSLGWAPFGVALGEAVAVALRSEPSLPSAPGSSERSIDLATAVLAVSRLHDACFSLVGARAAPSGRLTAEALAVLSPASRAVTEIATGTRLARVAPLTDKGVAIVADFVQSAAEHSAGVLGAWAEFAASGPGRAIYPVASIVGYVQGVLSGTIGSTLPRPSVAVLLRATVSAETARLGQPVLPLRWERRAVCSQCSQNRDGPSSCARINAFLEDPVQQVATFAFPNMQKLKHVVSAFRRYFTCRADVADRQLRLTKVPDTAAAAARDAAIAQHSNDRARLRQLEGLLERCQAPSAASLGGFAGRMLQGAKLPAPPRPSAESTRPSPPGSSNMRPANPPGVAAAAPSLAAVGPRPSSAVSPPLGRTSSVAAPPGSAAASLTSPGLPLPRAAPPPAAPPATASPGSQLPSSSAVVIDLVDSDGDA